MVQEKLGYDTLLCGWRWRGRSVVRARVIKIVETSGLLLHLEVLIAMYKERKQLTERAERERERERDASLAWVRL